MKEIARSRKSGKHFWSNRNSVGLWMVVLKFWTRFFSNLPKCCARSRIPGDGVLDHNERLGAFQKLWKLSFDHNERNRVFQKISGKHFWSSRNSVGLWMVVQKFWTRFFSNLPKCCARSRIPGDGVVDHNERLGAFQKLWKLGLSFALTHFSTKIQSKQDIL